MLPVRAALAQCCCAKFLLQACNRKVHFIFFCCGSISFSCPPNVGVPPWPHQPPGMLLLLWLGEFWFASAGICKLLLCPAVFVFMCDLPELRNISICLVHVQPQLLREWLIDFNNAFYPAVLVCWLPLCSPCSELPKFVCFPSFHAACRNFALLTSHLGVCCIYSV